MIFLFPYFFHNRYMDISRFFGTCWHRHRRKVRKSLWTALNTDLYRKLWGLRRKSCKWSLNFPIHIHVSVGIWSGILFFKAFNRGEFLTNSSSEWQYVGLNNMWNPRKLWNGVTTGQKLSKSVKIWTLTDWKSRHQNLWISWTNCRSTFGRISVNIWSSEPNQDSISISSTSHAQHECF